MSPDLAAAVEAARAVPTTPLPALLQDLPCGETAAAQVLRRGSAVAHATNVPGLEPTHVVWAPRALPRPPPAPTPELTYAIEDMRGRLSEARAAFLEAVEGRTAGIQWRE